MKVSFRQNTVRWLAWALLGSGLALASPALADVSRGYPAATAIAPGSLVALSTSPVGSVEPANQALIDRLFGVVVPAGSSSISLDATSGEVQVATSGVAEAFVSTADGDIKSGDYITLSPIAAVGMKTDAAGRIVGVAQEGFSAASPGAQLVTIGTGKDQRQVSVGEIAIEVGVTTYAVKGPVVTIGGVVQNFASAIAGKPVASTRLYLALIILLAAVVSSSVLIYTSVKTSIVAVGRNPLARSAIAASLAKILVAVVLILAVAGTSVWLVIR